MALPITMAVGLEKGIVSSGDRLGMLGIGSGINSLMLAAQWQRSLVASATPAKTRKDAAHEDGSLDGRPVQVGHNR